MRELECKRPLLTMALSSGTDGFVSAFELRNDSFNIHRDISLQNIINCNKLS